MRSHVVVALVWALAWVPALAATSWRGSLAVDATSFAKEASGREASSTAIEAGLSSEYEGRLLEARSSLRVYALASHPGASVTPDIPEAFVGWPRGRLRLGRVPRPWSVADRQWSAGFWEPRFTWDPIKPTPVGLAGLFVRLEDSHWEALLFASPVAIPERGMPIDLRDGRFSSPSPWFNAPLDRIIVRERSVDVRYDLLRPGLARVLLRPGAAAQLRYKTGGGFWFSAAYGYLPANSPELAASARLDPLSGFVEAEVEPLFYQRHLGLLEAGVEGRAGSGWWGSVGVELPRGYVKREGWVGRTPGRSVLGATGIQLRWLEVFDLGVSYYHVREETRAFPIDPLFELPDRLPFRRAVRATGQWPGGGDIVPAVQWTHDLTRSHDLLSFGAVFRPGGGEWSFDVGADVVWADSDDGFIGGLRGDDRVRGRVSHVF